MDYDSGFIAWGLLEMGMVSSNSVLTREFYQLEKLVESHTEKHRQTASALLCYRLGRRSTRGCREVKRSGRGGGVG